MSTDTITSPAATKSWLAFAAMFIAGLTGGAIALYLLSPSNGASKSTLPASAAAEPAIASINRNEESPTDAAALRELRLLREEVEQLRATAQTNAVNSYSPAIGIDAATQPKAQRPSAVPSSSAGQRTLAYWNELNSIVAGEAAMRAAPPKLTAGNAMSFVSGRTSAFGFAASAIRQLGANGVDPQVVSLGRDLAAWYDQGLANSRQAESLLGSDDVAARQGAAGKGWQSAEESHRQQCLEINRRGEQLRQELTRKYGLAFPALQ